MKFLLLILMVLLPYTATSAPRDNLILRDLQWVDEGYLVRQRALVDEIGRGEFGTRLRGDKTDLRLLQRILDEGLVNRTEKQKLQALGVALGDVYVNELGLEWKVYLDADGKSRATCLKGTEHCLFPITMISKRASLGVTPDVKELYSRGEENLQPYIPRLPYSGSN